jgi:hypothetical protein
LAFPGAVHGTAQGFGRAGDSTPKDATHREADGGSKSENESCTRRSIIALFPVIVAIVIGILLAISIRLTAMKPLGGGY